MKSHPGSPVAMAKQIDKLKHVKCCDIPFKKKSLIRVTPLVMDAIITKLKRSRVDIFVPELRGRGRTQNLWRGCIPRRGGGGFPPM